MADFALWATACETALWPGGTFWSAYCGNRDEAVEGVIDADPIAATVRAMMATRTEWMGTASDLLGALGELAGERVAKFNTWPDTPRALGGRLRRGASFLRKIGIEIGFEREGSARTRIIHIATAGKPLAPEMEQAQPSARTAERDTSDGLAPAQGSCRPDLTARQEPCPDAVGDDAVRDSDRRVDRERRAPVDRRPPALLPR